MFLGISREADEFFLWLVLFSGGVFFSICLIVEGVKWLKSKFKK